ncbi:MAG: helix-turn-helix domain-containing protein [Calditrichaeota bacterium]|nr:helix-turn-helix domain-containing protein [Calditrichota bacterium]
MRTIKKTTNDKIEKLKEQGALHQHPERIKDEHFLDSTLDFFDPNDLVQVKYEMLRSVEKEGISVTEASKKFGLSRPAFYQVQSQFQKSGVSGFVHEKPGPKSAHKLTPDIVEFIEERIKKGEPLRARTFVGLIKTEFNKKVHPRSIERAMKRIGKKRGKKK